MKTARKAQLPGRPASGGKPFSYPPIDTTTPKSELLFLLKKKVADAHALFRDREAAMPHNSELANIRLMVSAAEEKMRRFEDAPEHDPSAIVELHHANQLAENAISALARIR